MRKNKIVILAMLVGIQASFAQDVNITKEGSYAEANISKQTQEGNTTDAKVDEIGRVTGDIYNVLIPSLVDKAKEMGNTAIEKTVSAPSDFTSAFKTEMEKQGEARQKKLKDRNITSIKDSMETNSAYKATREISAGVVGVVGGAVEGALDKAMLYTKQYFYGEDVNTSEKASMDENSTDKLKGIEKNWGKTTESNRSVATREESTSNASTQNQDMKNEDTGPAKVLPIKSQTTINKETKDSLKVREAKAVIRKAQAVIVQAEIDQAELDIKKKREVLKHLRGE